MTTDSETPVPALNAENLKATLDRVRAEIRTRQSAITNAQEQLGELQEDERALLRVLPLIAPELAESREIPSLTLESLSFDNVAPEDIAVMLAGDRGGTVSVTELSRALLSTGRYRNERTAYGSAYSHLDRSERFVKSGRGEFSLVRDEESTEEENA